ncbi:MAG TPA: FAD-dependent oxidoreductase, partial [Rhodospirillaceae bacterium]|nr:FAD-dependent oxidoreductase [Rhodospirillaceae bacterium]
MAAERIECAVIGAGVVGLAVARELALRGREVIILESENAIGTGTSSRNSEVIHAGIYYEPGSLKARVCVEGKKQLYRYCEERGIPHRNCGKLIVATEDSQLETLQTIQAKAAANGVPLDLMRANEAIAMEPELYCVGALHSPTTGIIDTHSLMLAYQGDAEDRGAMIAFMSPVLSAKADDDGVELSVGGEMPMQLRCDYVVNCAGLFAPALARKFDGLSSETIPQEFFAKGNYYGLTGKAPFSRLIYPMPRDGGLGVHITVDMGGQARFGPDVEWLDGGDNLDYEVDPSRCEGFYEAIRTYWPGLPDDSL